VISTCFLGVGSWAALAPLSSAAIAPGQISPDGSQRTVQHLEGGIVRQIYVREGDTVSRGQPIMVLDKALAKANYQSQFRKLLRLRVMRDRLLAQESGQIVFQPVISEIVQNDATFKEFVSNEIATFRLKNRLRNEQIEIHERQELQVEDEIRSLTSQAAGMDAQVEFLDAEIKDKQKLVKTGLARLPELYNLQRRKAELTSESDAILSSVSRARQKIAEIRIAKLTLDTENLNEVAEELSRVNSEIAQAEEALNATDDVLLRTDIIAPIDGKILELNYKTIGGVVRPGEPIMTIVPINEELIVDAKLSPTDIDNVSLGMEAKVQLTSFLARHMLPIDGEVFHIGADVTTDPDTKEKFYALRIKVDQEDMEKASQDIELQAGMPADVFVQTGEHTPFRYLADPVIKSFNRAFREEAFGDRVSFWNNPDKQTEVE
ncbi:MAG: HlyD family type I secretion periplasmic adaptor subunit, partial [Pseudomonadota bacterium]